MMYTPIIYLRKLLIVFIIGLYSDQPVYALTLLLTMSALVFVVLLFYKPFKDDFTDYLCIAIEATLVFTFFALIVLRTNHNSLGSTGRSVVGYFILLIDILAILAAIVWWGWRTIKLILCCGKINKEEVKTE